jgi:hypothetical protein
MIKLKRSSEPGFVQKPPSEDMAVLNFKNILSGGSVFIRNMKKCS